MAMEGIKRRWRCFRHAFRREINTSIRKPVIHWLCWCFPLLLFALISSNFFEGTLTDLPVSVVDSDHSPLSRQLIRQLDAGPHASVKATEGGLSEAQQRIRSAKDYGILLIPENFEADLLAGRQPQTVFYYNALFYGAGLYSTQDFSGLINELNATYRPRLAASMGKSIPPLPKVELTYDSLFNASGSYIYYQQFAASIHLIQLFAVTCMIYVLTRSKPLIYSSSFSLSLLGKLAPYTFSFTLLLMTKIALLVWIFDARVAGNPLYMLIVSLFYVMAAQSIGLMLFTLTKSAITAYTMIGIFVSIALTFSGMAVPILSMPLPAQIIASLEPLTHALAAMFDIFLRQVSGWVIVKVCALLLLYPLIASLLLFKHLPARLRRGEVL